MEKDKTSVSPKVLQSPKKSAALPYGTSRNKIESTSQVLIAGHRNSLLQGKRTSITHRMDNESPDRQEGSPARTKTVPPEQGSTSKKLGAYYVRQETVDRTKKADVLVESKKVEVAP